MFEKNEWDDIRIINKALQDDLSKSIFTNRLLFSSTKDNAYLRNVCMTIAETRIFDKWIKDHSESELILFGAGKWGGWLLETFDNYKWDYFADNNVTENNTSLPVISFEELEKKHKNAAIVISSKYHWTEIMTQLSVAGIDERNIFPFGKLINEIESRIYFDLPQLERREDEVFVDVGGYNGDTTRAFASWAGRKWTSYIFEPNSELRQICKNNILDLADNIVIIPKGAWKTEGSMFFSEDDYLSCVSEEGKTCIEVTTLDKVFENKPVSFIKMDIEGAELEALIGATDTIRRCKPKLAISVYHKDEDIVTIPEQILRLNPDYKLFLRHYSVTWFDTVLYAI